MYLFESELPEHKRIKITLNLIYGLNKNNSQKIIKKSGFSTNLNLKLITSEQITNLVMIINSLNIKISNNLRKYKLSIFKNLFDIKSIRSFRLNKGLPVRGQRTHTNAKTARKKLHFLNKN